MLALCRQTPLLNGIKKSRFWQEFHCWGTELHCSRHRNLCTEHQRHFELGSRQAIPLLQGHRNLCTEHQKHFGVGFLDKEAVAHLMATIDTTEHTISGRAPPCCTTGSADSMSVASVVPAGFCQRLGCEEIESAESKRSRRLGLTRVSHWSVVSRKNTVARQHRSGGGFAFSWGVGVLQKLQSGGSCIAILVSRCCYGHTRCGATNSVTWFKSGPGNDDAT